jgi:hypothetical protein
MASIGLAASAAVIVASKAHERKPLSPSNFPHFAASTLVAFEQQLLLRIGFVVTPQATPTSFARHMLALWPESARAHRGVSDRRILAHADLLIGQFWKDLDSLRYAPSTVALSALLLTFSKYRMD